MTCIIATQSFLAMTTIHPVCPPQGCTVWTPLSFAIQIIYAVPSTAIITFSGPHLWFHGTVGGLVACRSTQQDGDEGLQTDEQNVPVACVLQ